MPIDPHVFTEKLGFAGVYLFFLFLLQSIDCGHSLEPPHRGGSNVYPQYIFWAKIRKMSTENVHFFYNFKISILHGHIFVVLQHILGGGKLIISFS